MQDPAELRRRYIFFRNDKSDPPKQFACWRVFVEGSDKPNRGTVEPLELVEHLYSDLDILRLVAGLETVTIDSRLIGDETERHAPMIEEHRSLQGTLANTEQLANCLTKHHLRKLYRQAQTDDSEFDLLREPRWRLVLLHRLLWARAAAQAEADAIDQIKGSSELAVVRAVVELLFDRAKGPHATPATDTLMIPSLDGFLQANWNATAGTFSHVRLEPSTEKGREGCLVRQPSRPIDSVFSSVNLGRLRSRLKGVKRDEALFQELSVGGSAQSITSGKEWNRHQNGGIILATVAHLFTVA